VAPLVYPFLLDGCHWEDYEQNIKIVEEEEGAYGKYHGIS